MHWSVIYPWTLFGVSSEITQVETLKVELSESSKYQEKYTVCFDDLNMLKEKYSKAASLNR